MIVLASTDSIQLVTTLANALDVQTSYVDNTTSTYVPASQNARILTATTTSIVGSPSAGTQRGVKKITANARGGANTVTVSFFDGVNAYQIISVVLGITETLEYEDANGWSVKTADGSIKTAGILGPVGPTGPIGPTGLTGQIGPPGVDGETITGEIGPQGPPGPTVFSLADGFILDLVPTSNVRGSVAAAGTVTTLVNLLDGYWHSLTYEITMKRSTGAFYIYRNQIEAYRTSGGAAVLHFMPSLTPTEYPLDPSITVAITTSTNAISFVLTNGTVDSWTYAVYTNSTKRPIP